MIVFTSRITDVPIFEAESDAILVVHPNAVETSPVASEHFKAISWGRTEIGDGVRCVNHIQLPTDNRPDRSWEFSRRSGVAPVEYIFSGDSPE
jgi:hypothetical protein